MMPLPPLLYHVFKTPLPYGPTFQLQHHIHKVQLARRKLSADHPDLLLLLQHRPVYTGGRRQNAQDLSAEEARLKTLGADWMATERGGETTFHGPGQIVAYPLVDLGRIEMSIREYICRLEKLMQRHIASHGLTHVTSEHTGLFLSATEKIGSIGVQVRHRMTTHGLALNVTDEPLPWFNQVVACGLADVKATSISQGLTKAGKDNRLSITDEMERMAGLFTDAFGRDIKAIADTKVEDISDEIRELENRAEDAGPWPRKPNGTD